VGESETRFNMFGYEKRLNVRPRKVSMTLLRRLSAVGFGILLGPWSATAQTAGNAAEASSIAGVWAATVNVNSFHVPFRFEVTQAGNIFTGVFFDGERRITSSDGLYKNGKLHLHFNEYATDLDATVIAGHLSGIYSYPHSKKRHALSISAEPYKNGAAPENIEPQLSGKWELRSTTDEKNGYVGKLILKQTGAELRGALLRPDGDSRALSGRIRGDKITLSHFAGDAPTLLEGVVTPDSSLELSSVTGHGVKSLRGLRPDQARTLGLPAPPNPYHMVRAKDAEERFHFRFHDLNGREVSDHDPLFQGKALIVSISGSWCPNCNDEAPFLIDLYRRHHNEGLEIVALSFEIGEDADFDRARLASFIQRHGIPYPVLLAGSTNELQQKLPQLDNLKDVPTTLFLGRDGKVKAIYEGFASLPTGIEHETLQQETEDLVKRLLNNKPLPPEIAVSGQ